MITERRKLRKAISEVLEDKSLSGLSLVDALADVAISVLDETRPRHKFSGEDANRLFRKVTGLVVIPPSGAMDAVSVITAMMREYGEAETEKRMSAAWAWWKGRKTKDGKPYGLTNLAWIEYAMSGQLPDVQPQRRSALGL